MKRSVSALAALLAALPLTLNAQTISVPQKMNFQGRVANSSGNPLSDGTYNFDLSLYNAASGGSLLWTKTVTNVAVKNGVFALVIDVSSGFQGSATLASVFNGNLVYLEMRVNGGTALTPRTPLYSNAYAFAANAAQSANVALSVANGGVSLSSIASGVLNFANFAGTITSSQIAAGSLTADKFAAGILGGQGWLLGGNSGTTNDSFLGTLDAQPLQFKVGGRRVMRYSIGDDIENGNGTRWVNILGGSEANSIADGVQGATISGGGYKGEGFVSSYPNSISSNAGTIGGGIGNTIFANNSVNSTISGGSYNEITGIGGAVGGGLINSITSGNYSTIGGGNSNTISGGLGTISGGLSNTVGESYGTVPGGLFNTAAGISSFAAGCFATAAHSGSFVWSDNHIIEFASTDDNQFLIRAAGGVGINTNDPDGYALNVSGTAKVSGNVTAASASLSGNFSAAVATVTGLKLTTGAGANKVLTSDANGTGTWQSLPNFLLSGATAGGDLTGTYPNPTIANGKVTSSAILDGTIAAADLADSAVSSIKLADGAVGTTKLADGTVNTVKLADNAVSSAKLSSDAASLARVSGGRMSIASGNVGIATTTPANALDVNGAISVSRGIQQGTGTVATADLGLYSLLAGTWLRLVTNGGPIQFYTNTTGANTGMGNPDFTIFTTGNATLRGTLTQNSDIRFKRDIATLDNALDNILGLRGVSYFWNEKTRGDGRQIGFIAQELEKVLPELVTTDSSGVKSVAYANMVPVAVEAIKAQQHQIATLKAKNAALEAKLDAVLKRLEAVEAQAARR